MSGRQGTLDLAGTPSPSGGAPAHPSVGPGRAGTQRKRAPRRIASRDGFVALPYVDGMLWRAVQGACEAQAQRVLAFRIDPDDVGGYARLFCDWWSAPVDLLVVEQDVIPPPHSLWAMHRCRYWWCTVPYRVGADPAAGLLGCARFALSMRRRWPTLARRALYSGYWGDGWAPWSLVDTELAGRLRRAGVSPHVHLPTAVHLHPYAAT